MPVTLHVQLQLELNNSVHGLLNLLSCTERLLWMNLSCLAISASARVQITAATQFRGNIDSDYTAFLQIQLSDSNMGTCNVTFARPRISTPVGKVPYPLAHAHKY